MLAMLLAALTPLGMAQAAPPAQAAFEPVVLPVIVPQQPTDVALHTHLVRIELAPDAQGTLVTLAAEYRLRNDNRTDALSLIHISEPTRPY